MRKSNDEVTFNKKELRGSRLRCLMLTAMSRNQIARCLTELVQPYGGVDISLDHWMPGGFLEPDETKLGETSMFLTEDQCKEVTDWWLAARKGANIPNWDIVSTCTFEDRRGLILVEAKAHGAELKDEGKKAGNENNEKRIHAAIQEANAGLNTILPGWKLSKDSHYQLCNRFAWSWKIASLGVPVILVYLGFLNAEEMVDQGSPFRSDYEWEGVVRKHSHGIIPDGAWNKRLEINDTPMYALIRTVDIHWVPSGGEDDRGAIWA